MNLWIHLLRKASLSIPLLFDIIGAKKDPIENASALVRHHTLWSLRKGPQNQSTPKHGSKQLQKQKSRWKGIHIKRYQRHQGRHQDRRQPNRKQHTKAFGASFFLYRLVSFVQSTKTGTQAIISNFFSRSLHSWSASRANSDKSAILSIPSDRSKQQACPGDLSDPWRWGQYAHTFACAFKKWQILPPLCGCGPL